MNLAEHIYHIYGMRGIPNTNRFPIALLTNWIDIAELRINQIAPVIYGQSTIDAVSNQRLYAFSTLTNLLDFNIKNIFYARNGTATKKEILTPISVEKLDELYAEWRTTTGTPTHWYIEKYESKFGLFPYDSNISSGTDLIRVTYSKKHTKMTHYYTTGTVSITNGSATLTGSGTSWSANLSAGDQIGIGKLLDSTRAIDFPTKWYTISSVDSDTQITLTANFSETTVSGGSYIGCSNSSIVYDELNMATVYLVTALTYSKDEQYGIAQSLEAQALERARVKGRDVEKIEYSKYRMQPFGRYPSSPRRIRDYN